MTQDSRPEYTENEPTTSTAVHDLDIDQDYEYCECFGTYEDDVRMDNGVDGQCVYVKGGFMLIASVKLP